MQPYIVILSLKSLFIVNNHMWFLNQARTWFLKIDPVQIVGMRVCVSTPEAINN